MLSDRSPKSDKNPFYVVTPSGTDVCIRSKLKVQSADRSGRFWRNPLASAVAAKERSPPAGSRFYKTYRGLGLVVKAAELEATIDEAHAQVQYQCHRRSCTSAYMERGLVAECKDLISFRICAIWESPTV
jgi:hypothetical protein